MSNGTTRRIFSLSAALSVLAVLVLGGCAADPEGQGGRYYSSYANQVRQRDRAAAGQQLDNLRAADPLRAIVTYPGDWPAVTGKRLDDGE
jgi:hypothetical protein